MESTATDSLRVRSHHLTGAEVAWFAPLCSGDDAYLSRHDFRYKSDWSNTSNVLLTADRFPVHHPPAPGDPAPLSGDELFRAGGLGGPDRFHDPGGRQP